MKRKVIKQGNNTLTITLPRKWVETAHIKAGDELSMEEKDGSLTIDLNDANEQLKYEADIGSFEKTGRRYLTSLYREGYDEICIRYENPGYVDSIQATLNEQMIGFEITNRSKNSCTIKDFSGGGEKEFETSLRRAWLLLLEIATETLEFIKTKDLAALKDMHMKDRGVNKFSNYAIRLLLKINKFNSKKTAVYLHFLRNLEELADEYQNLSVYISEFNPKLNNEELKIIEQNNLHLREFYELFYKYDDNRMEQLFIETKKTFKKIEKMLFEKKWDAMTLHYLFAASEGIRKLLSTIIEMRI